MDAFLTLKYAFELTVVEKLWFLFRQFIINSLIIGSFGVVLATTTIVQRQLELPLNDN